MTRRSPLLRACAWLGALALGAALAACSGGGDGGDGSGASSSASAPSSSTPSSSSPAVAGPTVRPTGTVGPLTADSDVASIMATAEATLRAADSFLFTSTVVNDGLSTVTSLHVSKDGTAMGTITTGPSVTGIRISQRQMWLMGPPSFWTDQIKLGAAGQAAVAGKWVHTTTANASFAAFSYSASVAGVAEQLFQKAQDATLTKTGVVERDGVPAVGVSDNRGSVLYVALSDPYRPLAVEPDPAAPAAAGVTGSVAITEWGAPVPFEAPPAEQTIEFAAVPRS